MAGPNLLIKKRLFFVLMITSILFLALIFRVGWIQIVKGAWFQREAFKQQTQNRIINARRGAILDRNMKELAISASTETISINPQVLKKQEKDIDTIAKELSEIIGVDVESIKKKANAKSRYEVVLKRAEKELGDKVRKWRTKEKLDGIYVDEDAKRYYPKRNLAAHVIGFTGEDNQGLDGIEAMMDKYLKGTPGKILSEVDAGGHEVPFNQEKHIDPKDGLNVVLTIDETIQYLAEKNIDKAIEDNKVLEGATAIVMDPRTGDILAMVSKPDFDLNAPKAAPPGVEVNAWKGTTAEDIKTLQKTVWRNKAVVDTYEPGSTFKAITSAAGLEENAISPDSPVNDFTVSVSNRKINCWKPNAHGNETFTQGVQNSCNPVFVRVAQSIGVEKFYKYVRAFGFYDTTNIGLSGEAKGYFHPKPTELDMAVASFGQRFTITPIQLITSYGAIANGGKLMKPRLVQELTDSQGNVVKRFEPEVVRNVISKQTSDTLKKILESVVSEGTGSNAYVKGYRVAGKTGTSETTQTKTTGRYIASFSAFAPADNPVICVLVVLDHPGVYPHTGGMIAAPVAGRLVEDILNYLNVERIYSERDKKMMMQDVFVPDLRNKSIAEVKKILTQYGLEYKIEGNSNNDKAIVIDQTPKANVSVHQKSVIVLYTYKPEKETMIKMPDVLNKTIAEATQAMNDLGLNIKVTGMGTAFRQSIEPGTMIPKGKIVEVEFRYLNNE